MKFRGTIEVGASPERAFAYLADFSNAAEWDPATLEARQLSQEPVEVGTETELVVLFRNARVRMHYRIEEYEPGRRVVLGGESDTASSTDLILFEPSAAGTRITYEAEVHLKGLRRLTEPLLGGAFDKMGREALAGIETVLNRAG